MESGACETNAANRFNRTASLVDNERIYGDNLANNAMFKRRRQLQLDDGGKKRRKRSILAYQIRACVSA